MQLFRTQEMLREASAGLASAPNWTRNPDSTLEVGDNWVMATDPNDDRGEGCIAYFDHARVWVERHSPDPYEIADGWEVQPMLTGIVVEGVQDGLSTRSYLDRKQILERLGQDWIDEVEETQRILEAAE